MEYDPKNPDYAQMGLPEASKQTSIPQTIETPKEPHEQLNLTPLAYNPKSPDVPVPAGNLGIPVTQEGFKQWMLEVPKPIREVFIPAPFGGMLKDGDVQSPNFRTGQTGWRIRSDGSAEFRSLTVGGEISGGFEHGTGFDGSVILNGSTDYNNFSSRSGSEYTLTRDLHATNLTINSGVTLIADGFLIFCQGTIGGSGTVKWGTPSVGGTGGNTTGATGGTAGTAGTAGGTGRFRNNAGATGGQGDDGGGGSTAVAGSSSSAAVSSIGSIGGNGGAGGDGGVSGAGGGTAGTISTSVTPYYSTLPQLLFGIDFNSTFSSSSYWKGGNGGAGGGGGGGGGSIGGGGGGGGGAGGGIVFISAFTFSGSFTIDAAGGNGGAGGIDDDGGGSAGGGGGGGGGGGATIVLYRVKTWTGSYNVAGGTGGTAGAGGSVAAVNGSNGSSGNSYEISISA